MITEVTFKQFFSAFVTFPCHLRDHLITVDTEYKSMVIIVRLLRTQQSANLTTIFTWRNNLVSSVMISPRHRVKPFGGGTPYVHEDIKWSLQLRMVSSECRVLSSWDFLIYHIKFVVKI